MRSKLFHQWHLLVLVLLLSIRGIPGARVLLLPAPMAGHMTMMADVGKAIMDAGHEVFLLTIGNFSNLAREAGVPVLEHVGPMLSKYFDNLKNADGCHRSTRQMFEQHYKKLMNAAIKVNVEILNNTVLMHEIQHLKFDFAVVDGLMVNRPLYILPYNLSIPFATITYLLEPWIAGVPSLPSTEPHQFTNFGHNMGLFQRAINLATYWVATFLNMSGWKFNRIIRRFLEPDKSVTTMTDIYKESEMWLITMDGICWGPQKITAPHYINVGVPGAVRKQALDTDLQEFMDNAKRPVVCVVFGCTTCLGKTPAHLRKMFFKLFFGTNYTYIMKYEGPDLDEVPENVLLLPWLPLKGLLQHNKTRLFISHGGYFSMAEAVHSGVPVLVLPIIGDHAYNAKRIEEKTYGKMLKISTLSPSILTDTVIELIENSTYRNNIQMCSRLLAKQVSPGQTVAFWVDHLIQFGSEHLRSAAMRLTICEMFMFDVFALCILTLCVGMFMTWKFLNLSTTVWIFVVHKWPRCPSITSILLIAALVSSVAYESYFQELPDDDWDDFF